MGLAIDAQVVVGEGGAPVFDPQKKEHGRTHQEASVARQCLFRISESCIVCARAGLLCFWFQHFYSPALTYFKGESASSGSSFPRCSFVLSIIQGADANAYAS